jgi:hypothetical protein
MDSGDERLAKRPKLEAAHDKIVVEGEEKFITDSDRHQFAKRFDWNV